MSFTGVVSSIVNHEWCPLANGNLVIDNANILSNPNNNKQLLLVIAGSCRNDGDRELLQNMKDLSRHLSLENNVEFKVNITHQELMQTYQHASIGLHTMWNEHFGIGVVESMAAGLIMVANRSGGPMMDIVEISAGSQTGFLAANAQEYAECIADILYNSPDENETIRTAAR